MLNKEKVIVLFEEYVTKVVADIVKFPPEVVFDDSLFHAKIITPSYTVLCASVGGITVVIPNLKSVYSKVMITARDEMLEQKENAIAFKAGGRERIGNIVRSAINVKDVARGVKRWIANKIMNFILLSISFFMVMDLCLWAPSTGGRISSGLIALVVSLGILYYEYKKELVLPFSNKTNELYKLHFLLLVAVILTYPLITNEMNWIPAVIVSSAAAFIAFLKQDGPLVLKAVKYSPKSFVGKRLIYAAIGAALGAYISYGLSTLDMLGMIYLLASLFFGYSITKATRANKGFVGARWANETEWNRDDNEHVNNLGPSLSTHASRQNNAAVASGILIKILDLFIAIPIGAIVLPYYLYLLTVPSPQAE